MKVTTSVTNCPNCGAILFDNHCNYCGTTIFDFTAFELEHPTYTKINVGGTIILAKVILKDARINFDNGNDIMHCDDGRSFTFANPTGHIELELDMVSELGVLYKVISSETEAT